MKKIKLIIFLNSFLLASIFSQKFNYTPGNFLLYKGVKYVSWGQGVNNDKNSTYDGCTPAYNQYCPSGNGACGRTVAGCAAVAMGQIMWKWEWPYVSPYRTYNWNSMPARLGKDDVVAGEAIANLLRDCGRAVNMHYMDINILGAIELTGSWCTIGDLVDGLKTFEYKSAKQHSKSDWDYGSAWEDLVRSEINAGRPVIYYGDDGLLSEDKHYFIIDGYSATNPSEFHINFGWTGNYNKDHKLNDISNSNGNFNSNQKVITGISPTYPNSTNENLYDVPYTSVSNTRIETARQNIALPASGKTLTVENGGDLTLIAGNSITLNPGFQAKAGSRFTAKIDPIYQIDKEIRIIDYAKGVRPKYNDDTKEFWIETENADSWEFQLFDRNGKQIWATAGTIENYRTNIWNGIDSKDQLTSTDYWYVLRLKNSYGRAVEIADHFTLYLFAPECREGIDVEFTPLNPVSRQGYLLLSPNGDGINDEVCFKVKNVAEWMSCLVGTNRTVCKEGDANGQSSICMADGEGFPERFLYNLQISYKGINGCQKEKDYLVELLRTVATRSTEINDSLTVEDNLSIEEYFLQKEETIDLLEEVAINQYFPGFIFQNVDEESVSVRSTAKNLTEDNSFLQKEDMINDINTPQKIIFDQSISLYPNPSNGIVFVRSTDNDIKNIRAYNMLGMLIYQIKENQLQTEIDLSSFPNGVYTFLIETNSKISTHKIILNKK